MSLTWTAIVTETAPAVEPISLEEAKLHLRVDATSENAYITGLIVAVRRQLESLTGRAFVTQTLDISYPGFPNSGAPLVLPRPPLQSVTSVKYYDEDQVEATLSTDVYQVDALTTPGQLVLKASQSWPSTTLRKANGVIVRQVCGYGLAAAVPQHIKQAMYLGIGDLYANREDLTVGTIVARTRASRWLYGHEKVWRF
jgi:uncharacterized phiE125 gp8 family phage protein